MALCTACWLSAALTTMAAGQETEQEKPTAAPAKSEPAAESKQDEAKAAEAKAAEAKAAEAKAAESTATESKADSHAADAKAADSKAAGAHAEDPHAPAQPAGESHGGAHGGHHDDSDLGHQNATAKLEDPSEWKSDLAICTLIVFLGLLLLLSRFAWGPVMEGLEKRERAIAANIDEARRSADKAAAQLRQYEAKLTAATDEAREIINQARKDADMARERILAEAQSTAQRERQRAIDDINMAKKSALQEMTEKSVDMAVAIAGQLVRKQLNRDDQAKLIRETLEKFPSQN